MTDLNQALKLFDRRIEEAFAEAESVLRNAGASESDLAEWRGWFEPQWREFVDSLREQVLADFAATPSRASH